MGPPLPSSKRPAPPTAPDLDYDSLDQVVLMHERNGAPVTLTDAHGKTVTTPQLRYSVPDRLATLSGNSNVVAPVNDSSGKKIGEMTARWTTDCDMEFAPTAKGPDGKATSDDMVISRVSMRGDVDVQHPKLSMKAQTLDLGFDPTAPKPKKSTTKSTKATTNSSGDLGGNAALKTVDATGNVSCIIRETTGNRSIDCEKLHLTADQGDDGRCPGENHRRCRRGPRRRQ